MSGLGSSNSLPVSAAELLDRIRVAVIVTDLSGRILQCNRQAEVVYGVPREELVGRASTDFATEPIDESVIEEIATHMLRGDTWEGDFQMVALDGTRVLVHAVDSPVLDDQGSLQAIVSASIDITDRWRLEQRLRAQHVVSRLLTEAGEHDEYAPEVIAVLCDALGFDCGGRWQVAPANDHLVCTDFWVRDGALNDFAAVSRAKTFRRGEGLPGRVWQRKAAVWVRDVVTDPDFPRASAARAAGLHCAVASPLLGGSEVLGVLEFFGSSPAEPDPAIVELMASVGSQVGSFARRRRAERAVRASEARRGAMLEVALDAVVAIDDAGRIIEFNPAAEQTFGYARNEVIGLPMVELIVPLDLRDQHKTGFSRYLQTGEARVLGTRIEMRALHRDGHEFPVELAIARVDDPVRPTFTGYIRDITNRVEAERALSESYRQAAALADTLQRSLLPPNLPTIAEVDLAACYLPAAPGVVGGDFYDVFERAAGDWILTIGDVCGNGPEAAASTALSRYTIRAAAMKDAAPAAVLATLNDALLRVENSPACTAIVARLQVTHERVRVTFAVGGHPLPIRVSRGGFAEPIGITGTMLGVIPDARHQDVSLDLEPNDAIVLYTDGVTESRRDKEFFGDPRLIDILTSHADGGAQHMVDGVESALRAFAPRLRDDLAILALQRLPTSLSGTQRPPRSSASG